MTAPAGKPYGCRMLADRQDQTFMSVPETAAALEVSETSVRRWVKTGQLRAVRLPSGTVKIRREDVEAILSGEPAEAGAA